MSKDLDKVRQELKRQHAEKLDRARKEQQLPGPRPFNWKAWRANRDELVHKLGKRWNKDSSRSSKSGKHRL